MTDFPNTPEPMSSEKKAILKIIFLTLFIDLIGFSLVFPLFPAMLEYYRAVEPEGSLFAAFHDFLARHAGFAGAHRADWGVIVLFGGILGSLYSLCQFLFAPLFGVLSDRVGRRPVLLISIAGMVVSYAMWFFAGSFVLLLASRLISGVMSANISTASAVVADITSRQQRSRGMAIIGVAFGLGFVLGPALGGLASTVNLAELSPALAAYGVNPFSMAAALALSLSLLNFVLVWWRLPETAPKEGASDRAVRTANPIRLIFAKTYPGVSLTNLVYFIFIFSFSGLEFSLTFMATDRFGYTPAQNGLMLTFVGVVLAAVQGGYVRRAADRTGPRVMAQRGIFLACPGLLLIAASGPVDSQILLFIGLAIMAGGMALVIPCLTSLVTLYAPEHDQGRITGIFRSLGALARAVGPLAASLVYFAFGSVRTYVLGAIVVLVSLGLSRALPQPPEH